MVGAFFRPDAAGILLGLAMEASLTTSRASRLLVVSVCHAPVGEAVP